MYTKEQINIILEKIKETKNYSYLINFLSKNNESIKGDLLEGITDSILQTNDMDLILSFAQSVVNIDIKKIAEKVLETKNISKVLELSSIFKYERNCTKDNIEIFEKIKDFIYENATCEEIKDFNKKYYESFYCSLHFNIGKYSQFDSSYSNHNPSIYEKKIIDNYPIYNEAIKQARIKEKNILIESYESFIKNESDAKKSDSVFGYLESFIKYYKSNQDIFEKEDEEKLISIMHELMDDMFIEIEHGIWRIDYRDRQRIYIVNPLKEFFSYYPNALLKFKDIILKLNIGMISDFACVKDFPYEEALDIAMACDHETKRRYFNAGNKTIDYVIATRSHSYDIDKLQQYFKNNYVPGFHEPLFKFYHHINGADKTDIEDFLFNYMDSNNENCYLNGEKCKHLCCGLFYCGQRDRTEKDKSLVDLIILDGKKYTRSQIEDKYISFGEITNTVFDIIDYDSEDLKKWEDFFINNGTQWQMFLLIRKLNEKNMLHKINLEEYLKCCLEKEQGASTAEVILGIMERIENVNLVLLEQKLIETNNQKQISKFREDEELQNRYFEQLLYCDDALKQSSKILLPKQNKN